MPKLHSYLPGLPYDYCEDEYKDSKAEQDGYFIEDEDEHDAEDEGEG